MAQYFINTGMDQIIKVTLEKVYDGEVSSFDLTDCLLYFTLRRSIEDDDVIAFKRNGAAGGSENEISVTDLEAGDISIYIDAADTDNVVVDNGIFDLVVETPDGKRHIAVQPTRMSIYRSVTRL
jgi:hypothetical protein